MDAPTTPATPLVIPLTDAPTIASYSPQPPGPQGLQIEIDQAEHRIKLINFFALSPGSRLLELGPGQGTCTTVLAHAVGPAGHIDAVDPGPGDYGAPFTLAQAHAVVSASAVGPRIAWHTSTPPLSFLAASASPAQGQEASPTTWDAALLVHSLWYFRHPSHLAPLLDALRGRARRLCVAEYALHATAPAGVPHVLAALARGLREAHRGDGGAGSAANIQTPLGPAAVRAACAAAGWRLEREGVEVPAAGLLDGAWEVGTVVREGFVRDVDEGVEDERVRALLRSAREATVSAAEAVGGVQKVQTMDVWMATFVQDEVPAND